MKKHTLQRILSLLVFVGLFTSGPLPAHAVDYYFFSTLPDGGIGGIRDGEAGIGSRPTVAGVTPDGSILNPGVDVGPAVEFRFSSSLVFDPTDRIFIRGDKPVRIIVTGDIVIPNGMRIDASPAPNARGTGGGGLGGDAGRGGDGGLAKLGGELGRGGDGGTGSTGFGGTGNIGRIGQPGLPGGDGGNGSNGTANFGRAGFNNSGGIAGVAIASGGAGGAGAQPSVLLSFGGVGGDTFTMRNGGAGQSTPGFAPSGGLGENGTNGPNGGGGR